MSACLRVPDESLNYWADLYVQRHVADFGVSLEGFLSDPHRVLADVDRRIATRNLIAMRRRHPGIDPCDVDDQALAVRDGRLVEKLRHGGNKKDRPTPFARRLFHKLFWS